MYVLWSFWQMDDSFEGDLEWLIILFIFFYPGLVLPEKLQMLFNSPFSQCVSEWLTQLYNDGHY